MNWKKAIETLYAAALGALVFHFATLWLEKHDAYILGAFSSIEMARSAVASRGSWAITAIELDAPLLKKTGAIHSRAKQRAGH